MLKDLKNKPIVVIGGIILLVYAVLYGRGMMERAQMYSFKMSKSRSLDQPYYQNQYAGQKGESEYQPYRTLEKYTNQNISQDELKMKGYTTSHISPQYLPYRYSGTPQALGANGGLDEFNRANTNAVKDIVAEKNNIEVEIEKVENKQNVSPSRIPYNVNFKGEYFVKNPFKKSESKVDFNFPLPQSSGTVSNVEILVGGKEPEDVQYTTASINWSVKFKPAEQKSFLVSYKTKGNNNFLYKVVHGNRIKEFNLKMKVDAIDKVDIPEMSIPPTKTEQKGGRWELEWNLVKMITVNDIYVQFARSLDVINQKTQILQLSKYIPLFLVVFFIYLVGAGMAEKVKIDIEQYFLLSLTFFLFYPLLGYLSGLLDIKVAIALSGALMSLVILNHLRRITNLSFALSSAGLFLLISFFVVPFGILYSDYTGIVFVVCVLVVIENLTRLSQKAKLNSQPAQ